jgi:hypothetical protein
MSYDMIVQPKAFRHCFLWHCLPAVLSPDKSGFLDEVSFGYLLPVPRRVPATISSIPGRSPFVP